MFAVIAERIYVNGIENTKLLMESDKRRRYKSELADKHNT